MIYTALVLTALTLPTRAGAPALNLADPRVLEGSGYTLWAPEGDWLLIGPRGHDGELVSPVIRRYSPAGELLHEYTYEGSPIKRLVIRHDGARFAAQAGVEVLEWDVASGALVNRYDSGLKAINNLDYKRGRLEATGTSLGRDHPSRWSAGERISGAPTRTRQSTNGWYTLSLDRVDAGLLIAGKGGPVMATLPDVGSSVARPSHFSPTSSHLANPDGDGGTYLWDLAPGEWFDVDLVHRRLEGLALSDDGERLLTWDRDDMVLWSPQEQTRRWLWRGQVTDVEQVEWLADGTAAMLLEDGERLEIREPSGEVRSAVRFEDPVSEMVIASAGETVAFRTKNAVLIWRPGAEAADQLFRGSRADRPVLSPSGRYLATVHDNERVRCWDLHSGELIAKESYEGEEPRLHLTDEALRIIEYDQQVREVDLSSGEVTLLQAPEERKARLQWFRDQLDRAFAAHPRPEGKRGATSDDGFVSAWWRDDQLVIYAGEPGALAMDSGGAPEDLPTAGWAVLDGSPAAIVELHEQQGRLIVRYDDVGVAVWDPISGERVSVLPDARGPLTLLPGRGLALATDADGALASWSLTSGDRVATYLTPQTSGSWGVHPASQRLSVATSDGVTTWDLSTGERIAYLDLDLRRRRYFTVLPSGALLIGDNDELQVVDPISGLTPAGFADSPRLGRPSVLSGSGALLAELRSGRLALRDTHTGATIRALEDCDAAIKKLAFSEDERLLWGQTRDGRSNWAWSVETGALVVPRGDNPLAKPSSREPLAPVLSERGGWTARARGDRILRVSGARELSLVMFPDGRWCAADETGRAIGDDPRGACVARTLPTGEVRSLLPNDWQVLEPPASVAASALVVNRPPPDEAPDLSASVPEYSRGCSVSSPPGLPLWLGLVLLRSSRRSGSRRGSGRGGACSPAPRR